MSADHFAAATPRTAAGVGRHSLSAVLRGTSSGEHTARPAPSTTSSVASGLAGTFPPLTRIPGGVGSHFREGHPGDPDPFTIGLGIFSAIAGDCAFLETRRRGGDIRRADDAFRSAWFVAIRTLIRLKGQVDEFETYVLEDGYGRAAFRIGAVRVDADRGRHRALRSLRRLVLATATHMGDDLDDLSEFLDEEYVEEVDAIRRRVDGVPLPADYRELIALARESLQLYDALLEKVGAYEGFDLERR